MPLNLVPDCFRYHDHTIANSSDRGCRTCTNGKLPVKTSVDGKDHYSCTASTTIANCLQSVLAINGGGSCRLCRSNYKLTNPSECTLIPEAQRILNCDYYYQDGSCNYCKPGFTIVDDETASPPCVTTPSGYEGCRFITNGKCRGCNNMHGFYSNGYSDDKEALCGLMVAPKIRKHDGSSRSFLLSFYTYLAAAIILAQL